jgi:hypothetical protein
MRSPHTRHGKARHGMANTRRGSVVPPTPTLESEAMSYYDCEETDRAVRAYHREGDRNGETRPQPSRGDSGLESDTVVLRGGGRVLARYRVRGDGRLRKLGA